MANSLILNIPHSSPAIPRETLVMRKNGPWISYDKWEKHKTLSKELPYFTDWFTDELFNNGIGSSIIAPVSRLLCDTERFEDDELEPMAKIGLGVCYATGHTGKEKFTYDNGHREAVIEKYYRPHHQTLENTVGRALCEFKTPIILDCHSFASVPLPYEPDQDPDRPDICIGSDDYHTPDRMDKMAREFFENKGFKVKINSPYAGSIVPMAFYNKDDRVKTIMLEINRKLYMDEESIQKNEHFQKIKQLIAQFEKELEGMSIMSNLTEQEVKELCIQYSKVYPINFPNSLPRSPRIWKILDTCVSEYVLKGPTIHLEVKKSISYSDPERIIKYFGDITEFMTEDQLKRFNEE